MKKNIVPVIRHLLSMSELDQQSIHYLLDKADVYLRELRQKNTLPKALNNKTITHLFFEPSTRTLNSFELAAKHLGAITLCPQLERSSTVKGESLLDTVKTFEAMGTDLFILRHADNNTAQFIASELSGPAQIINAGDGSNEHPTQTLIDLQTIRQHKPLFESISIAIVGDIAHSRVAQSLLKGLLTMQVSDIRLVAPDAFIPDYTKELPVSITHSLEEGLSDVDVVMSLRIQKERMSTTDIPDNKKFFNTYGLTTNNITYAKPDVIVMHPGPVNRGIEIESSLCDGPQSVVLEQVQNGVAMRMAILDTMLSQ